MPKIKDNIKTEKKYLIWAFFLICCIIVIFIFVFHKSRFSPIYSLDSRVENVKKEIKKDQGDYQTIGWLKVQGTNIDTPIIGYNKLDEEVQVDKENYLWNIINEKKLYNKVNIMGHNILNLSSTPRIGDSNFSRFDELMSFVYVDFVKDNKYIQYTIDGKDYIYKVFAVYFDYQYNLNQYHEGDYSKKELAEYLTDIKKMSIYDFDVDVNSDDKIISLVTCTRMFGVDSNQDLIVSARLVHKNENYTNYEVVENKNYKKIKKILKGDEVNDDA